MTCIRFRLPPGFTVRDLDFMYDVFRSHVDRCEVEYFTWNFEEFDCGDYDFDIGTLKAIRDDFAAHEWDVKPVSEVWGVDHVC